MKTVTEESKEKLFFEVRSELTCIQNYCHSAEAYPYIMRMIDRIKVINARYPDDPVTKLTVGIAAFVVAHGKWLSLSASQYSCICRVIKNAEHTPDPTKKEINEWSSILNRSGISPVY